MKLNFILGRGRSGTTLLSKILESNKDICSTPENLFIMNLYNKYKKTNFNTSNEKSRFVDDVWLEKNIETWKLDKEEVGKYLNSINKDLSFSEICQEIYTFYSLKTKNGAKYIFDKNPGYTIFAKELIELYPNTKFLHIVRNPKDNVMSYQNVPFEPSNLIILAYRWKYYNNIVERYKKLYPEKFLTIRYEDLVSNSYDIIQKICSFFSIDFDEEMVNFYKKDNDINQNWHKNLSKPLSNENTNKWQTYFKKDESLKIETICKNLMETYDYELENREINLNIKDKIYFIIAYILTKFEIFLFKLPLSTRVFIINLYRKFNR